MNERVKAIYEDIWTLCSEAFEAAKIDTIIKDRALLKPKEFSILLSSDEYQASLDVYKTLYEYEMAGFLIYLGLSDGSMDEGELRFIREYDSICKNPKFANSLGQASVEVFSNSVRRIFDVNFYEKDVPYVFKTAAEADLTQGRAYGSASFSERLYDLFFQLGEEFLACSEEGGKKAHRFGACMDIIKTYVSTYAGSALPSGEAPMPDPEPPVPDPKSLMPDPEPLMPDTKSLVLDPEPPVPDPEPPVPDPKPLVPDPEPGGAFSKGSSESEYNNNGGQNFEESSDSSGAIDEQIVRFAEEMVGLFGFGHVVSEVEIVRFINGRYGTDFVAIRPGDYCYNLIYGAADKRNKPKVFEMLGDGFYKCLGASYNYYDNLTSSKGLADERREDWKSQDKLMDLSAAGPLLSERGGRLEQDEEESLRFEERFGRFLMNYSESIQTRQKFFGLLRDIFPQHRLQTNLLSILHEIGIASEIEDSQRIDSAFAFRFEKRLTEEYGIAQNYAEWAVSVWCEYYGKRALGKQCDISARRAEYRDA